MCRVGIGWVGSTRLLWPKLFRLVFWGPLVFGKWGFSVGGLLKIIIIIGVMSSSQLLFGAQISVFSPTALPSIANKLPHELLPKKQKERTKCKSIKIISQKEKKNKGKSQDLYCYYCFDYCCCIISMIHTLRNKTRILFRRDGYNSKIKSKNLIYDKVIINSKAHIKYLWVNLKKFICMKKERKNNIDYANSTWQSFHE